MRKVLVITGSLDYGGVERLLVETAKELLRNGKYQPVVLSLSDRNALAPELEDAGVEVFSLGRKAVRHDVLSTVFEVRRLIREIGPAIVHTHQFASDFYGALGSLGLGIPIVSHLHNPQAESFSRRVIRVFLGLWFTDAFIATTEEKEIAIRRVVPDARVFLLYNAINPENLVLPQDFDPPSFRESLGIPRDASVLGAVGRLAPEKGFDILLRAFKEVLEKEPSCFLCVVGSGPEEKNLLELADSLDVSDHIVFTGYRKDVAALLSVFDILMVSSRTESFSLAALEALFVGTPLVITDRLSTKDIFSPAVVVVPLSPEALSEGALTLLRDENKRKELSAKGKELARRDFTIESHVRKLEEIYDAILERQ